jgi:hypothetical protein
MAFGIFDLTPLEWVHAVLIGLFVVTSMILGLLIIARYFKYKKRVFLFVGLTWFGSVSTYWGYMFNIAHIFFLFDEIPILWMLFFSTGTLAAVHVTWAISFTDLVYQEKKKKFLLVIFVESLAYEITYFTFLAIDTSLIGTKAAQFFIVWSPFVSIYIVATVILLIITGFLFTKESFKSDEEEVRLKGKFLVGAFITYGIGVVLELVCQQIPLEIAVYIITISRVLVIVAAFEFFFGFILPERIKRIFIK